jgi:nitrogen fixation NifU-like protein
MRLTLYSAKLIDHFSRPRNAGELGRPTYRIACENPVCGDQVRLTVECGEGRIRRVGFLARGCTASIACASALTELIDGRTVEELKQIGAGEVEEAVGGLIAESKHAAVLCADVVRQLEAAWKSS